MEIGARLHHLQLLTPEPERCAAFYAQVYAMRLRQEGALHICTARDRALVISAGPANRIAHAGFAFATPAAFDAWRARIAARVATAPADPALFLPGAVVVADPEGNRLVFGVAGPGAQDAASTVAGEQAGLWSAQNTVAGPAPDAPPARLQHFALRVREPAVLLPFYRDGLGFVISDRVCDETGRVRACFLRADAEHHTLALFQAAEARHDHLSFETTDWTRLRDWADRMSALRIPLAWGVGRHGPGNDTFFMIRDPDGNLAEISAELEVCAPTRAEGRWAHEERTLNLWGAAIMRS